MTRRRSKRKSTVLEGLTKGHGGLRRSKRKLAIREDEERIYGDDYGILPSGEFFFFLQLFFLGMHHIGVFVVSE